MKLSIFARAALACLMLILQVSVVFAAEPAKVDPMPAPNPATDTFGIVEAFQTPDLARKSGARWQRFAFFWNSIQPTSTDEWLPNHYSTPQDVQQSLADGIKPVGIIGNPPLWATRNGSTPKNLDLPIDSPDNYWARFVEKLVRQYSGQIDEWIIWNEPDFTPGHPLSTWAGSVDEYYTLLKTASIQAKAVNPKAKIIFAGTTFWFDYNRGERQFFDRVLEVAYRDPLARANGLYFDAVDVHLYSSPYHLLTIPQVYRDIMKKYGVNKPIWATELNVVPTDDPASKVFREHFRSSLDEQSSYVIQTLALARVAGIERASIYKMKDGEIISGEPFGLIRNDLSLRPAYLSFQVASTYLADAGQVSYRRQGAADIVTIDSGSKRTYAIWNAGPTPTYALIPLAGEKAHLIMKDGQITDVPRPGASGSIEYSIPLSPATANTDPGNASNYIIGGSPVILVEEDIRSIIELSPTETYFTATGFTSAGAFNDYFKKRGGLRTFGYPISRQFRLEGKTVQFYQRQVMEQRSDGTIGLLNLLDQGWMPYTVINGANFPAIDEPLTKTAPAPGAKDYAAKILEYVKSTATDTWEKMPVGFQRTFQSTVTAADAFPGKKVDQGALSGLNLELWGVPTSKPARDPNNDDFVYQRFQRGIMHYDKATGATQGLLLADYFKALITGKGIPADLDRAAQGSRFYRQYDNTKAGGLARPDSLANTDMRNAFERGH